MFIFIMGFFIFLFVVLVVKDINVIFYLENEFFDFFGYTYVYGCMFLGVEEYSYSLEIMIIVFVLSVLKNLLEFGCFMMVLWMCMVSMVNYMWFMLYM